MVWFPSDKGYSAAKLPFYGGLTLTCQVTSPEVIEVNGWPVSVCDVVATGCLVGVGAGIGCAPFRSRVGGGVGIGSLDC